MKSYFKFGFLLFCGFLFLVNCSKSEDDIIINLEETGINKEGYFRGTIRIGEHDLSGLISNITIITSGDEIKREVYDIQSKSYCGLIYKKDSDSVTYYFTNERGSWFTKVDHEVFKEWVTDLKRPTSVKSDGTAVSFDLREPFGLIFRPFDDSRNVILLKTFDTVLKNYPSIKCQTFLLGTAACYVFYDEKIKIRPELLELMEHGQPVTINTLVLEVKYFVPGAGSGENLGEKVLRQIDKAGAKLATNMKLKEIDQTENVSFEVPKNSKRITAEEMSEVIYPPNPAGGPNRNRSHDHDFF